MKHYDLIVIGGGPAGYVAAERAGERGLSVLLAENRHLGGVCLNEGCIPSKTMLHSAKLFHYATHSAAYGVVADHVTFDFGPVQTRKNGIIQTIRKGVAGLMKKYKVDVIHARASLLKGNQVAVGDEIFSADHVMIAAGSSPAKPPIPGADLPGVVDSTGILETSSKPESLVVIGGGVIGCEFACFFGSIGVPVTVIEMLPEICTAVDAEIAKLLRKELEKKNITFHLGAKVEKITEKEVLFSVGGEPKSVPRDVVLMATGRTPNVADLGLESRGVDFDRRGIRIDDRCATNVPGVWAAGDVTGRVWLAHAASRMGEVIVNNIAGRHDTVRYHAIPGVVYTTPEVATVGLTEDEAKKQGRAVKTAKIPMTINGRYMAEHDDERGITKVVLDAETRALMGVHMIGAACSEMIFGAASMIEMEVRSDEIADLVFPHPTVSEVMRDAVLAAAH
jgi:dihydrolipoamide dehydrogenase